MSKGDGVVGLRGGGDTLRRIVSRTGLRNAIFARSGMRDMTAARAPYKGKTAGEAERIATSLRNPVRVHVESSGGKRQVIVSDGRHRMQAAREAGATHIRATVVEYGARGGRVKSWTGSVKI